jgi:hypothetical protein
MGESTLAGAVTSAVGWIKDAMEIFTSEPAIYFVAFAIVGASAGVARRFVPMKKR